MPVRRIPSNVPAPPMLLSPLAIRSIDLAQMKEIVVDQRPATPATNATVAMFGGSMSAIAQATAAGTIAGIMTHVAYSDVDTRRRSDSAERTGLRRQASRLVYRDAHRNHTPPTLTATTVSVRRRRISGHQPWRPNNSDWIEG